MALLYLRAAERTLLQLARPVGELAGQAVGLVRVPNSWEETVLLAEPAERWLPAVIPFLVSRVVLAGRGTLATQNTTGGLRFVLADRPWQRPIRFADLVKLERPPRLRFSSRGEPGLRARIALGDGGGSDSAAVLSLGTLMLVTSVAARGAFNDLALVLRNPLAAWRVFAGDPGCQATAPLEGGGTATAVAIQRIYLAAVERSLTDLPSWTLEVQTRWREAIEGMALGKPPHWLEWRRRLDAFERAIREEPSWRDFPEWNDHWHRVLTEAGVVAGTEPVVVEQAIARWAARSGRNANGALGYLRVRRTLSELEAGFDQAQPEMPGSLFRTDQLVNAATSAPPDTRAAVRGKWVRRLGATEQRSRFRADWHGLWDLVAGTWVDLADPRTTKEEWRPLTAARGQGDLFAGFRDWLEGL